MKDRIVPIRNHVLATKQLPALKDYFERKLTPKHDSSTNNDKGTNTSIWQSTQTLDSKKGFAVGADDGFVYAIQRKVDGRVVLGGFRHREKAFGVEQSDDSVTLPHVEFEMRRFLGNTICPGDDENMIDAGENCEFYTQNEFSSPCACGVGRFLLLFCLSSLAYPTITFSLDWSDRLGAVTIRLGFVSHALSCSLFFQISFFSVCTDFFNFFFSVCTDFSISFSGLVLCQEERGYLCALGHFLSLAQMTSLGIVLSVLSML
jgi:hypothetical protein